MTPDALHGWAVAITIVLLLVLGGVFLLGFTEAIGVAIPLVAAFLLLNAVIVAVGLVEVVTTSAAVSIWTDALTAGGAGVGDLVGPAIVAFPLLVLGLSGFETGVSMMPLVAADGADPAAAALAGAQHPQAAHHRRGDHVGVPDRDQLRHHGAHPRGGVRAGRAGQRPGFGLLGAPLSG